MSHFICSKSAGDWPTSLRKYIWLDINHNKYDIFYLSWLNLPHSEICDLIVMKYTIFLNWSCSIFSLASTHYRNTCPHLYVINNIQCIWTSHHNSYTILWNIQKSIVIENVFLNLQYSEAKVIKVWLYLLFEPFYKYVYANTLHHFFRQRWYN